MIVASVVTSKLAERRLHDQGYGNIVRCHACDHTQTVCVAHCFRTGWPEHCGATMRLVHRDEQHEEVPRGL